MERDRGRWWLLEALCVGAARVGVSEPCVITAGRGLGRWHRRNRTLLPGACVCPGTGPYICRYARSRARVVNLGLCTSRRLITLHSVRVASYSSAGKSLKVARRAYTSHTSNCKLGPEGGTHAAIRASPNGPGSFVPVASASGTDVLPLEMPSLHLFSSSADLTLPFLAGTFVISRA